MRACVRACVCVCVCVCVSVHALVNGKYTDARRDIISMCFTYTVLTACKSRPCAHGGVCTVTAIEGYMCGCTDNYVGRNCQREFSFYHAEYIKSPHLFNNRDKPCG